MKKILWILVLLLFVSAGQLAEAQGVVPPQKISIQGFVVDSTGTSVNSSLPMKFRLYPDSLALLTVFEQDFDSVKITKGVYAVYLNVSTVDFNTAYWLETEINTHVLSPRTRLVSVPYALLSQTAQSALSAQYADSARSAGSVHASQYADSSRAAGTVRFADSARVAGNGGGGGGLTLPFADSIHNSSAAMKLTNSTGTAGQFVQDNTGAMGASAIVAAGNGHDPTISSTHSGSTAPAISASSSGSGIGVSAFSTDGYALYGNSSTSYGVYATSSSSDAIFGSTNYNASGRAGIHGEQSENNTYGELGRAESGGFLGHIHTGVLGYANNNSYVDYAVYGYGHGTNVTAGYFDGNVTVTGTLSKGGGSFKIDHPLDPANKYLYHSFVESPDMMNIYNGNAALDNNGEATITLPGWFEALNKDFRYQLTAVGAPGPNLYIAREESGNQFTIAGGTKGMKVSWQITGVRKDAWAEQHRIPVEENKVGFEKGRFLHPTEHGMPESAGISPVSLQAKSKGDK